MININDKNEYDYIKDEILQFISYKEITGAMLISGEWGAGKTYLLNEITNEISNENKYKKDNKGYYFAKVSLFGIDSIDTLHLNVKREIFFPFLNKKNSSGLKKILKLSSNFSNKAEKALNFIDINIYDLLSVNNTVFNGNEDRNLVLIFDDFERISKDLDMSLVLGAINYYVEQKDIKTIIVTNADKIKNSKFNEIQEKIISHIIHIGNIQEKAIISMINEYKEKYNKNEYSNKSYKDFLNANEKMIIQLFNECDEKNLRSIKYMLINFERIYQYLAQYDTDNYRKILSNILYNFGIYYLENRKNKLIIEDGIIRFEKTTKNSGDELPKKEMVEIDFRKYKNYRKSYRINSLINWIINNKFDKQSIVYELTMLLENNSQEYKVLLSNIEDLEDSEITETLNQWIDKVNKFDLCYKKEKKDLHTVTINELISIFQRVNDIHEKFIDMDLKFNLNKLDCESILKNIQKYKELLSKSKERMENISIYIHMKEYKYINGSGSIIAELNQLNEFVKFNNNKAEFINMIKNDILPSKNTTEIFINSFDNELYELIIKKYMDDNTKNFQRNSLVKIVRFILSSISKTNKNAISESINYTKKLLSEIKKYNTNIIQKNQIITHSINIIFIEELDRSLKELVEKQKRGSSDFFELI